jgi:hypothetical protein
MHIVGYRSRMIYPRHARLISDVYAGKLHSRIAVGLAPLMQLQIRVLEKTEVEKRLARLERLFRDSTGQQ